MKPSVKFFCTFENNKLVEILIYDFQIFSMSLTLKLGICSAICELEIERRTSRNIRRKVCMLQSFLDKNMTIELSSRVNS